MKINGTTPIPQGYKVTPLGIIPKEWEIYDFDRIVIRPKSRHLPNPQTHLRCIELEHLSQGDGSILGYIDSAEQKSMKNEFEEGDVLFGKLRPYLRKYWLAKFRGVCSSEIWVLRVISDVCTKEYLFDIVSSYNFVKKANVSSGSKMPRAEWDYVSKIPILTPPLAEQQKIAEVLGTWDKAIEKQSQLIKKLELRKKGLMQQLLTGKKRLLGFNKKWEKIKLGKIGKFDKGFGVPKDSIKENGNKAITYGEIYTKYNYVIKNVASYIDDETASISKKITRGAILFTGSGETLEDIGKCVAFIDNDVAYAGGDIIIFNPSIGINSVVLSYCLNSSPVNAQKWKYGQGFSVVHIYQKDLAKIQIEIPSLEEQTAIAQVLTAADHEIELAQQKLELLRQQKRGLMQQLLTGKKRVKI